jgi:thiamine pyrophosphokinase
MNAQEIYEQAMNTQRNVASFMLRLTQDMWQDENGEPRVQWRGYINHVQGEAEKTFTDFAEALAFIQNQLNELTLNAIPGGAQMDQEKVLKESFKLWEQFASSYSSMMFETMEKTIQQSKAIREQMDEAVGEALKSWPVSAPVAGTDSELLETLKGMQTQLEQLTKKVEMLEKAAAKK